MTKSTALPFILAVCAFLTQLEAACVTVNYNQAVTATNINSNTTQWEIYKGAISAGMLNDDRGILDYESPKQVRAWLGVMGGVFSVSAYYQPKSLDFFSQKRVSAYRRCTPTNEAEEALFTQDSVIAFTHVYLWSLKKYIPEWSSSIDKYATKLGVDLNLCLSNDVSGCGIETAKGLARLVYDEQTQVFQKDGWNAEGSMTKENHKVQFEEWRPEFFHPNPKELCLSSWKTKREACALWQLEYDDEVCWRAQTHQFGQDLYEDTYLLPHVAETSRSYFLSDEVICDLKTDYPCVNIVIEGDENVRFTRELNDRAKAEAEMFDNIWEWMNTFLTRYYDANIFGASQWEIIKAITAITSSMYEVTLVVWKEKLRHGLIRPRTIINRQMGDNPFIAYVGPEKGEPILVKGREWAPYIPGHSQSPSYPSHTACMCSVFVTGMKNLTNSKPVGDRISVTRAIGSSRIESNKPLEAITLNYDTWEGIESRCLKSVLNSGNVLTVSTQVAREFCGPIANTVVKVFDSIDKGVQPTHLVDMAKLPLKNKRCNCIKKLILNALDLVGITP